MNKPIVALAMAGTLGLSCALLPKTAHAYPPVPGPRVEVVPVAPGPGYIWRPGYWHWNGAGYVWAPGLYVLQRPAYHVWVPGHWSRRGWIPAHWR